MPSSRRVDFMMRRGPRLYEVIFIDNNRRLDVTYSRRSRDREEIVLSCTIDVDRLLRGEYREYIPRHLESYLFREVNFRRVVVTRCKRTRNRFNLLRQGD